MSTQQYAVYAYSPSLNQKVRRLDLANLEVTITEQQAHLDASFFASLQNTNRYMNVADWTSLVVLETHGYDTIPGFLHSQ